MQFPEKLLPDDLLARATLRDKEYPWPPEEIPTVIEAAKTGNLVSIGGQLQFRFPSGGTCECRWVQVNTYRSVPYNLPWAERVERSAEVALAEFQELQSKYDFIAEGRTGFEEEFQNWEAAGGDPAAALCFVWYVTTPADEAKIARA